MIAPSRLLTRADIVEAANRLCDLVTGKPGAFVEQTTLLAVRAVLAELVADAEQNTLGGALEPAIVALLVRDPGAREVRIKTAPSAFLAAEFKGKKPAEGVLFSVTLGPMLASAPDRWTGYGASIREASAMSMQRVPAFVREGRGGNG